jgi:thiol-disulfide isomerase/thioredoxin
LKLLEELDESFRRRQRELDRAHIEELTELAARSSGPLADAAFRELFDLAILRELCPEARRGAEACLASTTASGATRALATLVRMIAAADSGKKEEAIALLRGLLRVPADRKGKEPAAEVEAKLAVVEAYVRRLIRGGRYDHARELCSMICEEGAAPDVLKEHFEGRMDRLDLLGKPAPAIEGTDVEGKKVSLAGLRGKVVLVDFWATWCPPCVAAIPALKRLEKAFGDRGFVILGVNQDARRESVNEVAKSLPLVRKFLAEHEVTWTNLLDAEGAGDFAKAYGVEEIPANFLVGRDGKVVALELGVESMEAQIARALGPGGSNSPKDAPG